MNPAFRLAWPPALVVVSECARVIWLAMMAD
jgi:hypothetical protein